MELADMIAKVQGSWTIESLTHEMQLIIEKFGFSAWCMIDAGKAYQDVPFYFGTSGEAWHDQYRRNGFLHVDPYISKARRTNLSFDWSSIQMPDARRGPKTKIHQLMEAAHENGWREGLIFPAHFNDDLGRRHSAVCVFYWTDSMRDFYNVRDEFRVYLHVISIYFLTKAMDLAALSHRDGKKLWKIAEDRSLLTDRERDVISWAARGKTAGETANILTLSEQTVVKHIASVIRKVGALNRTHAVAKCLNQSLIDL
jgi:DNA-binding CsgD family transcriptional regulator